MAQTFLDQKGREKEMIKEKNIGISGLKVERKKAQTFNNDKNDHNAFEVADPREEVLASK